MPLYMYQATAVVKGLSIRLRRVIGYSAILPLGITCVSPS
jgi:hypothetical protein